jgi:mono/diheme cytochrome c family protein
MMKKVFKVLGVILLLFVVLMVGAVLYIKFALPNVGEAPVLTVEATPERIERGRYLANSVNVCMDCHSTRDWSKFAGPVVAGTLGKGGERFDQTVGFPGAYFSKNITPAGISRYTDGELYRVITTGVNNHGKAMFPVMPYPYYGKMDDEDIYSIIAYLRTLKPIDSAIPESQSDFPMSIILNTIPAKGTPQKRPDPSDELAYGQYLTNASGCIECHTQVEKGQVIPALAFGGGREFPMPGGIVRSSNISPDEATGIGKWSPEAFVQRFKIYTDSAYTAPVVKPGEFNTVMPWEMYGTMTESDLRAIFTYLKTVKPISNSVERFTVSQ